MGHIKRFNIHIMGILGEEKEKETESFFKDIMARNSQYLKKKMNIQLHETQWITTNMYPKKFIVRHIIIKLSKVKGRNLKESRECDLSHAKGIIVRLSADSSAEILQARKEYHNLLKSLK